MKFLENFFIMVLYFFCDRIGCMFLFFMGSVFIEIDVVDVFGVDIIYISID